MTAFALLAIMATCGLIVWFVATVNPTAFSEDDGTQPFYGVYSLAISSPRELPVELADAVEANPSVRKIAYAIQQQAQVTWNSYNAQFKLNSKPSGMGERRSPAVLAIGDDEPPFELSEGRWINGPSECVIGSSAEDIIVAVPGDKPLGTIKLGEKLDITTDASSMQFTVVGKIRQKLPQDIRGQTSGMYAFGFGIGLGGKPMGGPAPQQINSKSSGQQQPTPPPRRRGGRRMGGAEVSPTTPSVYISMDDMAAVFERDIPSNIVFVQLVENADYDTFYRDIEQKLGGTLQDWGLKAHDSRVKPMQKEGAVSPQQIVAQAWSTVGIVIIASIFIIFTTLSMGVSTRTRQLAMLRTIGFTRLQVALYIILEGLALGIIGWIGGMVAGWLLLTGLVYANTGHLPLVTLSPVAIAFTGACSLCGAFLASIIPAYRAMRISPTESMIRNFHAPSARKLFRSGLYGVLLLALIPVIVFLPQLDTKLRLLLFSTVGSALLGFGFLLFIPWTITFTEKWLAPPLARLLTIHPRFLSQILTENYWRTLGTTLALSIGLALFTAINIWGSSMLNMFWTPKYIPDTLVRFHEGLAGDFVAAQTAKMPGIKTDRLMAVTVAQPNFAPAMQQLLLSEAGAMAGNAVVMGVQPEMAFRKDRPMLNLRYVEGSRESVLEAFSQPNNRVCVIPETLSKRMNLHVGDSFGLEESDVRKREVRGPQPQQGERKIYNTHSAFIPYEVVAVIDFPWVWFSKCSGVRVSAGRTAALLFAPYDMLIKDFGAIDNEFFWFDHEPNVTYAQISDYMKRVAAEAVQMKPQATSINSYSGGTLWDSGINKYFVMISSNESLNNSLASRSYSVLDAMAKMPLLILLLSTFAVLNTIIVSVRARRWEIGVLRACGVTRNDLIRMILAESLLIGLCACVLSFCFGLYYAILATKLVDYAPIFGVIAPPLTIPWTRLLPGYAIAIIVSAIAGILPAVAIARKETALLLQRAQE
ncbi:MAG: FtsX-like permease family protein [Victivallales bacterium]|nr:FtsX-like permease family protein [Victivallales bacterium]